MQCLSRRPQSWTSTDEATCSRWHENEVTTGVCLWCVFEAQSQHRHTMSVCIVRTHVPGLRDVPNPGRGAGRPFSCAAPRAAARSPSRRQAMSPLRPRSAGHGRGCAPAASELPLARAASPMQLGGGGLDGLGGDKDAYLQRIAQLKVGVLITRYVTCTCRMQPS